jgi:glucose-6-phosphate isomerase
MDNLALWHRFKKYLNVNESVGVSIDISRMKFADDFFGRMGGPMQEAFAAMEQLEAGAVANPDEGRMVGHYWLRDSARAPDREIRKQIDQTVSRIKTFSAAVHAGSIRPQKAKKFTHLLAIGIGGSALGPQFVSRALGTEHDAMTVSFFDNTDPDGMDKVLAEIGSRLSETLTVVISKSGGTRETRNGMLEAKAAYEQREEKFPLHAVAVTGVDSELDKTAHDWLDRFPMWDWVGGRTSELSAVGLLPAALQGLDIEAMLDGARAMDEITRRKEIHSNPAALMALMWYHAGNGRGQKDMVILPYKDRLELFSRYLQQLVMESLGKEKDLDGKVVRQGIAVYGNKGSTDQHAYVQQLREGVNNFFVTFVEVLKDRSGKSIEVEEDVTSGDYLNGFLQGTRRALFENDRESITITIDELNPAMVGKLIALYERAVGFYASLVNINAYHQPGVEAGKKAAATVIEVQRKILAHLRNAAEPETTSQIARAIDAEQEIETVFKVLRHLSANPDHGMTQARGKSVFEATYSVRRS